MSALEAAYRWASGEGFGYVVLAAWLAGGVLVGHDYLRARRVLSDTPDTVSGPTAGDRPHNPGRQHDQH